MRADPADSAATTYAIVVGIEQFKAPDWRRDGLAAEACGFVSWLLEHDVPPANILLFLNPLDPPCLAAAAFPQELRVFKATRAEIEDAIQDIVRPRWTEARLLFLFWSGHGVIDQENSRYLFYGDADLSNLRVLSLSALMKALRAQDWPAIPRQIAVVNACANYVEFLTSSKLSASNFPCDLPALPVRKQLFLYSASAGEQAAHMPGAAESFATLLRQELGRAAIPPWPPRMLPIAERLKQAFQALKARDIFQTPALDDELWDEVGTGAPATTPEEAPPAGAVARRFSNQEVFGLGAVLGDLPLLQDPDNCARFLLELPFRAGLSPDLGLGLPAALADRCLHRPGGVEALLETLERFMPHDPALAPVYTTLQELLHTPVPLTAVSALKPLLAREPEPVESRVAQLRPKYADTFLFEEGRGRRLVDRFVDFLARQPCEKPGASPLVQLVQEVRSQVSDALRTDLTTWLDDVAPRSGGAARTDIGLSFAAPPMLVCDPLLQIVIEADAVDENRYRMRAWLDDGGEEPQDVTLDEESYPRTELSGRMVPLLLQAHRRLGERADRLRIEFVLPIELLDAVDRWTFSLLPGVTHPLGARYPVAVRSLERVYGPDAREAWAVWWARLNALDADDVPLAWLDGSIPETLDTLRTSGAVCAGPLPAVAPATDRRSLGRLLAAGAPVALWCHETESIPASAAADLEDLVREGALTDLPGRVRDLRAEAAKAAPGTLGRALTLLWDDPERLPPDALFAYEALD